jgi:hypothetical protein
MSVRATWGRQSKSTMGVVRAEGPAVIVAFPQEGNPTAPVAGCAARCSVEGGHVVPGGELAR